MLNWQNKYKVENNIVSLGTFFLFIFVVLLAGCGTQDQVTGDSPSVSVAGDASVVAIQLTANTASIGTNGTLSLTATLFDASGQLITGSKIVTFTLDNPALGSVTSPVTITGGTLTQVFTARSVPGSVSIFVSSDNVSSSPVTIQISDQVQAAAIALVANPISVTPSGTSVVSATVTDGVANPMPDGTTVNFSVDNASLGTISATATTSAGIAQATFSAGVASVGTASITASAGSVSNTIAITVVSAATGSIEFSSAIPQVIVIQGAGGTEVSTVGFLIKDSNGDPAIGSVLVDLVLSGPNGGEYLGNVPGVIALQVGTVNGLATVNVHSGLVPGTVTVTATVNGTGLSTSSGVISIGGGVSSAGHFSLSADRLNVEGLAKDNVTDDILALIADRYGNYNVLEGTAVSFYAECGAIDTSVSLDAIGQGTVTFRTQTPVPADTTPDPIDPGVGFTPGSCGPICDLENIYIDLFQSTFGVDITADPDGDNPRDGLCTIVAVVDGEEEFTDNDADGLYDPGEPFDDTYDDTHIDKDDDRLNVDPVVMNNPYDAANEDLVVDADLDGVFDGLNGAWDSNKRISKRINLLYTGSPMLTMLPTTFNVANGGSQTINFALHDRNYNRPIGGTTLTVALSGAGALSGIVSTEFIDSSAVGAPFFSITITDSDPTTNVVAGEVGQLTITYVWDGITVSSLFTGLVH